MVAQLGQVVLDGCPDNRCIHPEVFVGQHVSHVIGVLQLLPKGGMVVLKLGCHLHDTVGSFAYHDDAVIHGPLGFSVGQKLFERHALDVGISVANGFQRVTYTGQDFLVCCAHTATASRSTVSRNRSWMELGVCTSMRTPRDFSRSRLIRARLSSEVFPMMGSMSKSMSLSSRS